MSPIQQMLLGVGGAGATKTYVDDIFSTFLYTGTGSAITINNGINLSESGGLVWTKSRQSENHGLGDTINGTGKVLLSNSASASQSIAQSYTAFNNNGYTIGNDWIVNRNSSYNYASWTVRKAPGFFTICEWTGNGSGPRSISHDLGSVPGLIMLKRTDGTGDWIVFHSSLDVRGDAYLRLNATSAKSYNSAYFGGVFQTTAKPTATSFNIGTSADVNGSGGQYIAYVFAGGESTAATARSVDFDGSGDYLSWAASSDFAFGTGAYTVEFWLKPDTLSAGANFFNVATTNGFVVVVGTSKVAINQYSVGDKVATSTGPTIGQWTHYALVREGTGSNQTKIYENGVLVKTGTDATDWSTTHATGLGANVANGSQEFDGKISNFRIVKGTAVYTSSFRPPTEPLANITNTKLLCCNNSSTTGSTVTPGTITANGDPTANTDSPFDDPAAFTFGDAGDQNVIKCGSYVGNGSATAGVEVNLGWEPQFIILKESDNAGNSWSMWDPMRGITTGGNDALLEPNSSGAEWGGANYLEVTPTGFKLESDTNNISGREMIYIAIRRSDGYCGKPAEAGTDVFAMDTGSNSSTIPNFDSGFPVDFAFMKTPASSGDWYTGSRTLGEKYLKTNSNSGAADWGGGFDWDSNVGWLKSAAVSAWQSWMWKRHAGMDVVTYTGNGTSGHSINHSLGTKSPEMIWIKRRDTSGNAGDWMVGHKALNGGSSPWNEYLVLNKTQQEYDDNNPFNNVAPTTTSFQLSNWDRVNANNSTYISMLFASVDNISKVGNYTTNSTGAVSVTLGFQPRLVIIKRADLADTGWVIFDSERGLNTSGNNPIMQLNANYAQDSGAEQILRTATGFTVSASVTNANIKGTTSYPNGNFIYYAHA